MALKNDNGDLITLLHNDIIKLIPHRHPFLLIDKITDINLNKSITGIKAVTFNEPYFPGHFPEHPVMPGVLIFCLLYTSPSPRDGLLSRMPSSA